MLTNEMIEAKREKMIEQVRKNDVSRLKRFKLAYTGKGGARNAIRAFCCYCMGLRWYDAKACEVPDCPLWLFRPGQKPIQKASRHDKAYASLEKARQKRRDMTAGTTISPKEGKDSTPISSDPF